MKVYDGTAMIVDKADAPVMPVRIDGLERSHFGYLSTAQTKKAWFPKTTVTILPPVKLKIDPDLRGKQRRLAAGADPGARSRHRRPAEPGALRVDPLLEGGLPVGAEHLEERAERPGDPIADGADRGGRLVGAGDGDRESGAHQSSIASRVKRASSEVFVVSTWGRLWSTSGSPARRRPAPIASGYRRTRSWSSCTSSTTRSPASTPRSKPSA